MITGFNTDIEHDGVVYHVQTEDKGIDTPLILSLVYVGGEILASKRSRYEDLILAGFDETVLAERLKRQHRLICAAINAGRLEDLKRMGSRAENEVAPAPADEAPPSAPESPFNETVELVSNEAAADENSGEGLAETPAAEEAPASNEAGEIDEAGEGDKDERVAPEPEAPVAVRESSAYTVYDPRRQSPFDEVLEPQSGVVLTVLDEDEFRAGESFTIRVLLEDRSGKKEKPLAGIAVSVKILGASFRPQLQSVKTARDGVAIISVTMPDFNSGRAAILIRAVVKGETVELRRVIHPAE